jgi:hypothetical protein
MFAASMQHNCLMPYRRKSFSSNFNMAMVTVDINNNGKATVTM